MTGENGTLVAAAGRDLTLIAAAIVNASPTAAGNSGESSAGGRTLLSAGRDLKLDTVQESFSLVRGRSQKSHVKVAQVTDVGTRIVTDGDLALVAGHDLTTRAADVQSSGALTLAAGNDLTIATGEKHYAIDVALKYKSSGGLGSTTIEEQRRSSHTRAVASALGGDTIDLQAGRDIAIRGSEVIADHDLTLLAGRDIAITAAQERHSRYDYTKVKDSGLMDVGGAGVMIGSREEGMSQDQQRTTAAASTVGSIGGDISILAGRNYLQEGSQLLAPGGDIDILAKRIDIREARETERDEVKTWFKQSGVTVAVSTPLFDAVQTMDRLSESADNTSSRRMDALALASAGLTGYGLVGAVQKGQGQTVDIKNADGTTTRKENQVVTSQDDKGNVTGSRDATAGEKAGGLDISISYGSSKSQSKQTATSDTAAGSTVAAGGNLTLVATGGGADSDITVQGSNLTAGQNISLLADDEIRLLAAQNRFDQHSKNSSSSFSIGVSWGTSGLRVNGSASRGQGKADGNDVAWSNTHVQAGDTLTLIAGGDTTLMGAVAGGRNVLAAVGGDLILESLQDTSSYHSSQKSAGFSFSVGFGKGSASASAAGSKIDSHYRSVVERTGLLAGDGGFDVRVKGDTTLTGAVIASTDAAVQANRNRFDTDGTLTLANLQNEARYKASSYSVHLSTSNSSPNTTGGFQLQGNSAGIGRDSDHAASTTTAGISGLAGNTAVRTNDAPTGIDKIFDANRVQKEIDAQAQITQLFGQKASQAWGDYANNKFIEAAQAKDEDGMRCWGPDGACRAGGHALIGGATGGLPGAAGAASSSVAAPYVAGYLIQQGVPPGVAAELTGLFALGVGNATGGTAAGAAALNEASNNFALLLNLVNNLAAQAQRLGPAGIRLLDQGAQATLRACTGSAVCMGLLPAATAAWLATVFSSDQSKPSDLVSQIPGFGEGEQPKPTEPMITPVVQKDPRDNITSTPVTPSPGDNTTGGNQILETKPGDWLLVNPNNGVAGPTLIFSQEAKDFERSLVGIPDGEKQAVILNTLRDVANENGLVKDGQLSRMNGRDVFIAPDGNLYAVDYQHGRFEVTDSRGKHLGEVNISLEPTKPADKTGGHDLKVR